MAYEAEISRVNPTCFLFLIDQSGSMSERFGGGQGSASKADELALAINRCIHELIIKCSKDMEIYRYFQVGIIGYGYRTGPALSGNLASQQLVWVDELYQNPLRVDTVQKQVPDGAGGLVATTVQLPVWFEPISNGGTPMNNAFQQAYAIIERWVYDHPTAFPPIVMNFTDGEPTDGDPSAIAHNLTNLSTQDGNVLLLNLHLSSSPAAAITFPDSETNLPDNHAKMLFRMASVLPDFMRGPAADYGYPTSTQSRAFIFNARIEHVIGFLNIGTRPSNLR
jgi:hypothetical protein